MRRVTKPEDSTEERQWLRGVLSQICFFESSGVCKSLNCCYPIFGFCPQNRNLRQNPRDGIRKQAKPWSSSPGNVQT
jgi:hypothetical protein